MWVFKVGLIASLPLLFVWGAGILMGIVCVLGMVICFFFARTQASLLEVMLIMVVSSLPIGLAAKFLQAGL